MVSSSNFSEFRNDELDNYFEFYEDLMLEQYHNQNIYHPPHNSWVLGNVSQLEKLEGVVFIGDTWEATLADDKETKCVFFLKKILLMTFITLKKLGEHGGSNPN